MTTTGLPLMTTGLPLPQVTLPDSANPLPVRRAASAARGRQPHTHAAQGSSRCCEGFTIRKQRSSAHCHAFSVSLFARQARPAARMRHAVTSSTATDSREAGQVPAGGMNAPLQAVCSGSI